MSSGNYDCEIFINYHGRDVEENLAKSLYHRLREHELRVFMDVEEKLRKTKDRKIERAIRTASVHIALFSHAYAESPGCLEELVLMLKTGATIIPIFYRVLAREIKFKACEIKEGNGQYGESLRWKERFEGVPKEIIKKWSDALSSVSSLKKSFRLKDYNSDVERLVNAIVEGVKESICYDVFINNDRDIQKTFATHLYRRLLFDGRRVFLDKETLREGNGLTPNIESAIQKASVRIAILCTKYAESSCCLNELLTMFRSNATIIPVFYGVKPSKLRSQIRDYTRLRWQNGPYDLLLRMLGRTQRENGQGALAFDSATMENWKNSIDKVTGICGFELEEFNEDHGLLVSKIAERVSSIGQASISYDVFINHRGDDCKKTLASHLYHRLVVACGLRPFLDKDELQRGEELTSQIKHAIKIASVHIVILSKNYANSEWCMKELVLMLQTKAAIIPVLYNVEIRDLLRNCKDGEPVYARAVHNLEAESTNDPGTNTFESWEQVLLELESKPSFNLKNNNDDEGLLVDKVVEKVAQVCKKSSYSIWSRGKRS